MAAGEIVAVAENRAQRLRDGPARRLASRQVVVDAERLELAMQPLRPFRIGVGIRQESAILEIDWGWHGLTHLLAGLVSRQTITARRGRNSPWPPRDRRRSTATSSAWEHSRGL